MSRSFFRKVMWVGCVTTFRIGLAVVLAVAIGVTTTALAAVPGVPLELGGINYASRATTLAGAILRVDNDGTGTALDLKVGDPATFPQNKATASMKVDSQAKVANLNSDELDGPDSGESMREPGYTPWVKSNSDSSRHKVVTAP